MKLFKRILAITACMLILASMVVAPVSAGLFMFDDGICDDCGGTSFSYAGYHEEYSYIDLNTHRVHLYAMDVCDSCGMCYVDMTVQAVTGYDEGHTEDIYSDGTGTYTCVYCGGPMG